MSRECGATAAVLSRPIPREVALHRCAVRDGLAIARPAWTLRASSPIGADPTGLAEFDDVAGFDPAGRAMKEIAVDDAAQFRRRQGVIASHQVSDLEAAVLADGLEGSDD